MKRRNFFKQLAVSSSAVLTLSNCKKTNSNQVEAVNQDYISEPAQQIPIIAKTDILIIGGGPAGVAAAISAGRTGVNVILVERYNHLGGLWTGGLVLPILPTHVMHQKKHERILYGIGGEIEDRLRKMGMVIHKSNGVIDPEAGKYMMDIMIKEAGVQMLYHAWASNVIIKNNQIEAVIVETKSGRGAIVPKIVIDCTGDGDIFHMAGEEYDVMKYDIGLVHRLGNINTINRNKPGFKRQDIGQPTPLPGVNWVNMVTGDKQDGLDAWNLSKLQQQYRIDIWDKFKEMKNTPGYENVFLLDTASQLGVRMSRILKGEYTLTQEESMTHQTFKDVIGVSGAWTSIMYKNHKVNWNKRPKWQIPYRALLPKKTNNLLVAGRCFSFEPALYQDTRVIGTCLITGHGAGAGAAIALKQNTTPKKVDVTKVQKLLKSQNALLS